MLRSVLLAAARSSRLERLAGAAGPSPSLIRRFVAGQNADDALVVARRLADDGLAVTVAHLGAEITGAEQARANRDEYRTLLGRLQSAGLTPAAEVSLPLSAIGRRLDATMAFEYASQICVAAADAGTTVTLDAEDLRSTDAILEILTELRKSHPATGVTLPAHRRRTEGDCRELATAGSRVRLSREAHTEPESVAFASPLEVDKSVVRCLNILMSGEGYPMVATDDPRLIAIAEDRARWFDRSADEYEFHFPYGVRPDEQARLAAGGAVVRVQVPYGERWYGYLMRQFAERPADVAVLGRAFAGRAFAGPALAGRALAGRAFAGRAAMGRVRAGGSDRLPTGGDFSVIN